MELRGSIAHDGDVTALQSCEPAPHAGGARRSFVVSGSVRGDVLLHQLQQVEMPPAARSPSPFPPRVSARHIVPLSVCHAAVNSGTVQ